VHASSWNQVFLASASAGSIRLSLRKQDDLAAAARLLAGAESMLRSNSRLDAATGVAVLYNLACLGALTGQPAEFSLSRLLEALHRQTKLEKPVVTSDAVDDDDLKPLKLRDASSPDPATVRVLAENRVATAPDVERLVREGLIDSEQLRRIVAAMIRQVVGRLR